MEEYLLLTIVFVEAANLGATLILAKAVLKGKEAKQPQAPKLKGTRKHFWSRLEVEVPAAKSQKQEEEIQLF